MKSGFVYIAENESMEGILKIGMTERHPNERMKELQTSGVPTPFKIVVAYFCHNCEELEQCLHHVLKSYRVASNREFFKCSKWLAASEINRWFTRGLVDWRHDSELEEYQNWISKELRLRVKEKISVPTSNSEFLDELIDSITSDEWELILDRYRRHHRLSYKIQRNTMEVSDE